METSHTSSAIDEKIYHISVNPTALKTILLIHGAMGSHKDWDMVTPYLRADYHLLMPDLPVHGGSKRLAPFSPAFAARLICDLILAEVPSGKAHVVGFSLGSHVALALATTYPDVVDTLLISGFQRFEPKGWQKWLRPYAGTLFYLDQRMENVVPRSVVKWLLDGADLPHPDPEVLTPALCRDIMTTLNEEQWPEPWPARTLIICAIKSGIVPSLDNPEQAVRLANIGRKANKDTFAVASRQLRHPWLRQKPELFAETIRLWIEKANYRQDIFCLSSTAWWPETLAQEEEASHDMI